MCKNAGIDTRLHGYGPKFAFLWAYDIKPKCGDP